MPSSAEEETIETENTNEKKRKSPSESESSSRNKKQKSSLLSSSSSDHTTTTTTEEKCQVPSLASHNKEADNSDLTLLEQLGDAWYDALEPECNKPYFKACVNAVSKARTKKQVYPPENEVFTAFRMTPLDKIKVVIVGQDPYHQPNQAMGMCFSVKKGIKPPPSLVNIFKEIGITSNHGDLTSWAEQGVFLLNALLTVEESSPMAHKNLGWDIFTDRVIEVINENTENTIFFLWGKPAQKKAKTVDREKHHVLEAGHPSPLSVRFFTGCQHFQKANELLEKMGEDKISWALPS